jgi:DNA-binding PadR family transcriptional regulator
MSTPAKPAPAKHDDHDLLARLAGGGNSQDGFDPWQGLTATEPEAEESGAKVITEEAPEAESADAPKADAAATKPAGVANRVDQNLDQLLDRINRLRDRAEPGQVVPETQLATKPTTPPEEFFPPEPRTWDEAKVSEGEVEALVLKYLLSRGNATGAEITEQIKLPFTLLEGLFRQLKHDQLVVYRDTAAMGDYQYQLTDLGRERARRYAVHCTYFGAAPVALDDYIASVGAQSLTRQHPTVDDLRAAFDDLLISKRMMDRLGPAINSGRGMFLYGAAGNGKTSIAERVTRAFGQIIWIPRAIGVDGEIIRLFDPSNHLPVELDESGVIKTQQIDRRWIRIQRPTIVAGGELTMSALEVASNQRGATSAEEQLRHARDRRLRPPEDANR